MTNQEIEIQIYDVADMILEHLGGCNCNPHVAIAALAVAMCSLARTDGTTISEIEQVVATAHDACCLPARQLQ